MLGFNEISTIALRTTSAPLMISDDANNLMRLISPIRRCCSPSRDLGARGAPAFPHILTLWASTSLLDARANGFVCG
jgi:hypothetical protein